ncbi:radical SAM/SPASM domain-containing protein [Psychrilyobacter atlanticus]|uniref:radical SAM/SPASM domain-containing protein n=1 Tax=Psychrilyobacter atlanticus TaxID=271091 RepID=UPI0003F4BC04|nr:radical SAM protein [Psychrilyobacter atlanticus]
MKKEMKKYKKVYIEITNRCNLKCSFCPQGVRIPKVMSLDEFRHILDEIKPYSDYVYLHVKGEPLSHPEIAGFLDIAEEKNIKVNITTNGTLIGRVGEKIVNKKAFRQINFSLHSFDGDIDKIDKDDYLKKILDFTKKSLSLENTYISLRLWNFHDGNKSKVQMEGNRKILEKIERYFDLDYKIEDKLVPGRGLKIKNRLYLNTDLEFKWPELADEYENEDGFCYGLRTQIGILVDGTVIPCCLDGEGVVNLGNVFETSFKEIVEGERATAIYDGFSNKKAVEELCKKCTFKEKF